LYFIYGATTAVGLPDACLQDLLLGLSRSCSNTNCAKRQKWQQYRAYESNAV